MRRAPLLLGLGAALVGLATDQAVKLWALFGARLAETGPIQLAPFAELRLIWNYGISYGLLQTETEIGRWGLVAFSLVAVAAMTVWLVKTENRLVSLSLGFIVGGALGNAFDRAWWGAVVDYAHLFLPDRSRSWYVFNLADVWIVVGVVGLLYDSVTSGPEDATKAGS